MVEGDEIKAQLYAALMKKYRLQPDYRYYSESDGRQFFRCECSAKGFETVFVAVATAQQKKQAQTKAAVIFGRWMVDHGHLAPEDLPQLAVTNNGQGQGQ